MVNYCCAYNCTSVGYQKNIKFHRFPLKDPTRLQKWIQAVRRKNFKPSANTLLCSLHFLESDYTKSVVNENPVLKKDAIPSVFNFPDHLIPKKSERRVLQRISTEEVDSVRNEDNVTQEEAEKFVSVAVQTTLTGIELQRTLNDLRREKKCLQQQLARRNRRVSNMSEMLELLEKNNLADDAVSSIFSNNLKSSHPFELFENELHNLNHSSTNRRYSQEMKQFCLTLHFYSPRAYEFIRSRSTLPDPSTLRRRLATRKCDPGILHEVLEFFNKKKLKQVLLMLVI